MAVYTDNFPQANENPLSSGGNWVVAGAYPRPQVFSNRVRVATVGDECNALYNTAVTNDQFSQITVPTWNAAAADKIHAGVLLRSADAPTVTRYEIDVTEDSGALARCTIYRVVNDTWTNLYQHPTVIVVTAGDVFNGETIGTNIYFYINTLLLVKVIDAAIASGKVGLTVDARGLIDDVEADDFIGGDAFQIVKASLAYFPKPKMRQPIMAGRVF